MENIKQYNKINNFTHESQLKELQNQIIENIEKNPNYDNATKYHLKKFILNSGFYGNYKPILQEKLYCKL